MPQNAPMVLTVGETDVTFNPTGIDSNNVASFRNRVPTQLVLQPTITVGVDEPRVGGRDTTKGMVKLTQPREESSATGAVIVKNDIGKFEMVSGAKATKEEREALLDTLIAALSDAGVRASLTNPEHYY